MALSALSNERQKSFSLFITHVDGDGPFLKISGQVDKDSICLVESLIQNSIWNFENGIGSVPSAAILEGVICAAKYKDGAYYRAKVINITNLAKGIVGVHFIDFGNTDYISVSTIRVLDKYDHMLLEVPGQSSDYYLANVINPSGKWQEPHLLKLRSFLCYYESPVTILSDSSKLPIISIQYQGNDLSQHLEANRYALSIPVEQQEAMLSVKDAKTLPSQWQPGLSHEQSVNNSVVTSFINNSNFPSNPASTMRLQQMMPIPYNTPYATTTTMPPSAMSQRLAAHRVSRVPANMKTSAAHLPQCMSEPPPGFVTNAQGPVKQMSPRKSTYKTKSLEVNSEHKVFVSCADDGPELFAVQLVNDRLKLDSMMNEINRHPYNSLNDRATTGTVCLGRMALERIICRAIVMDVSTNGCRLFFVDFGNTETVSYYDIFDIPEEFVKHNVFALRFCLSGFKKLYNCPQLKETFKEIVKGKVLTLKVVPAEGPPLIQYGELYLHNQNVFDLLSNNVTSNLSFKYMDPMPAGTKRSVLVSYVDSCVKFFVQLSDQIDSLNSVMGEVKAHCQKTKSPGVLPVGSVCCAKFPDDGNWYRANVLQVKGDNVVVSYVDYGNEQEISASDLRTITADLLHLPAQALKCALKGYENKPVETKTSNQLEMLALEKTLMAHVVGTVSTDIMLVSLIDDTVLPVLDVARRMTQLSQPRSSTENRGPPRKDATPFSSPEENSEDGKHGNFRREKSFKEERRPRDRDNNDDYSQSSGSFRERDRDNTNNFERSPNMQRGGQGRHSDRFSGKQDRGDRRGNSRPWENKEEKTVISAADDQWDDGDNATQSRSNRDSDNGRFNRSRDGDENKFEDRRNKFDRRENRPDRRDRDNRADRRDYDRDNRADRRDNDNRENRGKDWGDRDSRRGGRGGGRGAGRSNFNPRDRAERSFDDDKKSDKSFGSDNNRNNRAPYRSRSNFTPVQYKQIPNPVSLDTPYVEPTIELNSQQEVSVTWIVSPENFYTQILSLQPKFLEMMHKIPVMYKGVKSYEGTVTPGASVLAKYPEDGVLYRAQVLSSQPFGKYIVQYIDFGNKFLVESRDIWQLDHELMELPKMAVHCSLAGVSPLEGGWKSSPEIDLCFNAPRYQCVFLDQNEECHCVSLWNNGVSVADMLLEKGLSLPAEQTPVTLKDEPIDLTIIVGQQITCKVTNVHSFEKFHVQLDLDKAARVEKALEDYNKTLLAPLSAETLANDIHCTCKHEDKIFRATLEDVSDLANIIVLLPDYGRKITTSIDNLMILPTELSVYYYQALECSLNNYTSSSNALLSLDELKEKLTGNKFIIYINDVQEITLITTLYDCVSGKKVEIFEPDEGAYEEVTTLNMRSVFNYNLGLAYVTHLENLNEIYVTKTSDGDRIAELLEQMFQFYDEGKPEALDSHETDTICAAKSSDGNWYRGIIVSATESECKVQFSDYGNSENIAFDLVKKLDSKFYEPCSLALVVGLGLVALQDDALTKLTEWTAEKDVQVTLASGNDGWLASLHLDGVDLSMKLVNEGLATPQVTPAEEPKEEILAEEPISLPAGCTQVYISHIDTPGQFWLHMSDKIDKLEEIQAELQKNSESYPEIENREMGTICVAKYSADEMWYRAEILDSDADITTVRFIDYGNTDVLDNLPGLLKAIPDHLKDIERFAIKSSVNAVPTGTGQWSEPASDYFTELFGDLSVPVNALIVLKDVTTYVDVFVGGQNLTDKLVSEGHAIKSDGNGCENLPSCFASHVNSPSEFWIQLESATAELQAMEVAMVDAENFPELSEKEEGIICAAKYLEDGAWYRAQIIVDGSEGTEVLFMDYGNASITPDLRCLPEELKIKPALSRKCALQKPREIKCWSRKSEIRFNDLAAEGATVFKVQFIASGDISIVELYYEDKSVTEELVGLSEEIAQLERPVPVSQESITTGKVSFVNSADDFYVVLDKTLLSFKKIEDKLINCEEFEAIDDLKIGLLYAAFWVEKEKWVRVKVLQFCEEGTQVQFVDYGNKSICNDFRQLPEDILEMEPLAELCCLTGETNQINKIEFEQIIAQAPTFQIEFIDCSKEPKIVKLLLNSEDIYDVLNKYPASEKVENDQSDEEFVNQDLNESLQSNDTVIENISFSSPNKESSDDIKSTEAKESDANTSEHIGYPVEVKVSDEYEKNNSPVDKIQEQNSSTVPQDNSKEVPVSPKKGVVEIEASEESHQENNSVNTVLDSPKKDVEIEESKIKSIKNVSEISDETNDLTAVDVEKITCNENKDVIREESIDSFEKLTKETPESEKSEEIALAKNSSGDSMKDTKESEVLSQK